VTKKLERLESQKSCGSQNPVWRRRFFEQAKNGMTPDFSWLKRGQDFKIF